MRKQSTFLMSVLILICICAGCKGTNDVQSDRIYSQCFSSFCRMGEHVVYAEQKRNGQYLYYYDAETAQALPLCGKPECTHDIADCGAFIDNVAVGLGSTEDAIYWIEPGDNLEYYMLYRENPDGTKRKALRRLERINEDVLPIGMTLYDSENMYTCGNKRGVSDGQEVIATALYVYPKEKGEKRVLFEEQVAAAPAIQIFRNKLYLSLVKQEVTEENGEIRLSSRFELRRYDLKSWEEEILFQGDLDFVPFGFYVLEDRILLTTVSSGNNWVYSFHMENRTIDPAFCFSEEDEYEVLYLEENRVIGYAYPKYPDFSSKKIRMTDFEGNVLFESESEERMRKKDGTGVYGRMFYGSDETGVYFMYVDTESEPETLLQRMVRIDLTDGSETELTGD